MSDTTAEPPADELPADQSIELTFSATYTEYARAIRWASTRTMGSIHTLWKVTAILLVLMGAYGIIEMFNDVQSDKGRGGFWIFLGALYLYGIGYMVMKRLALRRVYAGNEIFCSQRDVRLDAHGYHSSCPQQTFTVPWSAITGLFEDDALIYLPIGPSYTLFIPKRIAASPEDIARVTNFIQKFLDKSTAEV